MALKGGRLTRENAGLNVGLERCTSVFMTPPLSRDVLRSQLFGDRNCKPQHELAARLNEIAATRSELRFVHLNAHLKTHEVLTAEQICDYSVLRGYSVNDPCDKIPAGHSLAM